MVRLGTVTVRSVRLVRRVPLPGPRDPLVERLVGAQVGDHRGPGRAHRRVGRRPRGHVDGHGRRDGRAGDGGGRHAVGGGVRGVAAPRELGAGLRPAAVGAVRAVARSSSSRRPRSRTCSRASVTAQRWTVGPDVGEQALDRRVAVDPLERGDQLLAGRAVRAGEQHADGGRVEGHPEPVRRGRAAAVDRRGDGRCDVEAVPGGLFLNPAHGGTVAERRPGLGSRPDCPIGQIVARLVLLAVACLRRHLACYRWVAR